MFLRRLIVLLLLPFLATPGSTHVHVCLAALASGDAADALCDGSPCETSERAVQSTTDCCAKRIQPTEPSGLAGTCESRPSVACEADSSTAAQVRTESDDAPCNCCVDFAPNRGDAVSSVPTPASSLDLRLALEVPFELPPLARTVAQHLPRPERPPARATYSPLRI